MRKVDLGKKTTPQTTSTKTPQTVQNSFIHHVYFWLKNPNSAADKAKLIAGLQKMLSVPNLRGVQIGTAAATNRGVIDRSYAVSWLCIFDNAADQEVYQTHPIHLQFVAECSDLWEKVIVYDSVSAI